MPRRKHALGSRKITAGSRVTNGVRMFLKVPGVDQRSTVARRARDIARAIISDLGGSLNFRRHNCSSSADLH